QAYAANLRRGCRYIEIDVWDGSSTQTRSRSASPGDVSASQTLTLGAEDKGLVDRFWKQSDTIIPGGNL
ncbi:hypothetical protein B0T25DRAFT_579030, partial [Lasiosphaeria hispida]